MAASAAGGPVGKVAAYFLNLWQHTTLPEVFSALMAMDLADRTLHARMKASAPMIWCLLLSHSRRSWNGAAAGRRFAAPACRGNASFLAVLTAQGWRVGKVPDYGPGPSVVPAPDARGRALLFRRLSAVWPEQAMLGWDGRKVGAWLKGDGRASYWARPLLPPAVASCRGWPPWLDAG